jgi:predicted nucleic acid-binding protein
VTKPRPTRIFLDTNVFVIGTAFPESSERTILSWAGYGADEPGPVEIIVSAELFEQVRRVSKRVGSKDWAGQILSRIWRDLRLRYVLLDLEDRKTIATTGAVPREDIDIFLTARAGQAQCFVSTNHELIVSLASLTGEFECLTPEEFVQLYLQ